MFLLYFCLLFAGASDPSLNKPIYKEITKNFQERLDKIASPKEWTQFVKNHPDIFPDPNQIPKPHTVVNKEELVLDGESFTVGAGHRQALIKTSLEMYKSFLNKPELFQFAYGLDGVSSLKNDLSMPIEFLARIQKKIPGIEDQDYTLKYSSTLQGNFYFVRAPLHEDKKQFALRDNLKVLEKTNSGVIVREISLVYPLRWWVRAMGPTMRNIMKDEMTKVSLVETCIMEQDDSKILLPETSKDCWKKISK